MSKLEFEAFLEHADGVGIGVCLLIGGLVLTIGNIGPGSMVGLPMLLMGILVPLVMTHNAQNESIRQEKRRRPEHDSNTAYNIRSKNHRRRDR
jgi:hypothetical protein